MEIFRKKVKDKRIKNHKGSTMVETLVSFVVLFIVLAALYRIVTFSSELYFRSVDTSRLQQRFYREIYKTDPDDSFIEKTRFVKGYGGKVEDNGEICEHAGLTLIIVNDGNLPSGVENSEIALNQIGATSYVCKEDNSGNGIVPKVVNFFFDK